jgi:ribosomal protein S18 acetylase RimI-like enzyme
MAMLGFYGEPRDENQGGLEIVADLLALAVAQPFQRTGIGATLLDHVIEVAGRIASSTNARWLRLTVESHNQAAQRLYVRAGFGFDHSTTTTYESGLVGLRMRRPI